MSNTKGDASNDLITYWQKAAATQLKKDHAKSAADSNAKKKSKSFFDHFRYRFKSKALRTILLDLDARCKVLKDKQSVFIDYSKPTNELAKNAIYVHPLINYFMSGLSQKNTPKKDLIRAFRKVIRHDRHQLIAKDLAAYSIENKNNRLDVPGLTADLIKQSYELEAQSIWVRHAKAIGVLKIVLNLALLGFTIAALFTPAAPAVVVMIGFGQAVTSALIANSFVAVALGLVFGVWAYGKGRQRATTKALYNQVAKTNNTTTRTDDVPVSIRGCINSATQALYNQVANANNTTTRTDSVPVSEDGCTNISTTIPLVPAPKGDVLFATQDSTNRLFRSSKVEYLTFPGQPNSTAVSTIKVRG